MPPTEIRTVAESAVVESFCDVLSIWFALGMPQYRTSVRQMTTEAVIFDMDGLLIDSEPLWRVAMIELFAGVGVELDEDRCRETMGLRIDEVVDVWYEREPWTGLAPGQLSDAINRRVIELVEEAADIQPGVQQSIDFVATKGVAIGLASSSGYALIDAGLGRAGIRDYFDVVHSAQDEKNGKPNPDVYLSAAAKLGVEPEACIAVEDSPNGILAAKAAKMRCLVVPDPDLRRDPAYLLADAIVDSLEEFDERIWSQLTRDLIT